MLLTSSQVSIAISSFIIVIFTSALFLSGYVIQQRTLRDLRRAIKPDPRPSPKIYLPDRFKGTTTELEDGRVMELQDGSQEQFVEVRRSEQKPMVMDERHDDDDGHKKKKKQQQQKDKNNRDKAEKTPTESRAERRRRIKQEIRELSQGEAPVYYQRRLW